MMANKPEILVIHTSAPKVLRNWRSVSSSTGRQREATREATSAATATPSSSVLGIASAPWW